MKLVKARKIAQFGKAYVCFPAAGGAGPVLELEVTIYVFVGMNASECGQDLARRKVFYLIDETLFAVGVVSN
ncbi:hypothetical protein ASD38_09170 [Caulobacter sp. Root487D2Y]|nr:hypothetical protein ASD38_09170 [Caulobacter sp. Root487D2Y]